MLLSLSKVLSGKVPPASLTPSLSRANAETCIEWISPQVKGSNVPVCRVTVWKAAGKGISVQEQWRESREHLSVFTEQHRFLFGVSQPFLFTQPYPVIALSLFLCTAKQETQFLAVIFVDRAEEDGGSLFLHGFSLHTPEKRLIVSETSPAYRKVVRVLGKTSNGSSSRLCSNMGRPSSSKNIAKKFLTVAISEELEAHRWCSELSFFTQCNTVQSLLQVYFFNSFVCIKCSSLCGLWPVGCADWGCRRIFPYHLIFLRQSAVFWIHLELWIWAWFCFSYFVPTLYHLNIYCSGFAQ